LRGVVYYGIIVFVVEGVAENEQGEDMSILTDAAKLLRETADKIEQAGVIDLPPPDCSIKEAAAALDAILPSETYWALHMRVSRQGGSLVRVMWECWDGSEHVNGPTLFSVVRAVREKHRPRDGAADLALAEAALAAD